MKARFPILDLVDVVESGHRAAVGPADFEVGLTVERIIDRACKVIVVGDQRLDRHPILVDIGPVGSACDGEWTGSGPKSEQY
jgi:hypothetical protein